MFLKKDFILNNLTMKDVLEYYGIKIYRQMFCCPFHIDKTPSAKYYKNTFFCFTCGKGGDLIKFVQDYFNISFVEAMVKLNQDFNLNIPINTNIDKKQLDRIRIEQMLQQKEKEEKRKQKINELINICDTSQYFEKEYNTIKNNITPYNWEENEVICSIIEQEKELLNIRFNELYKKSDY